MEPNSIEETSLLWSINEGLKAENKTLREQLKYFQEAFRLAKEANKFIQCELMQNLMEGTSEKK